MGKAYFRDTVKAFLKLRCAYACRTNEIFTPTAPPLSLKLLPKTKPVKSLCTSIINNYSHENRPLF